jgi:pimeloyl-ACP methyl ester carboxylesterase
VNAPLVLIHGLSSGGFAWQPVLADLARNHDVVVLELPGHLDGVALDDADGFTVEALVDHCRRELDARGIDRAHLVGNSLGGWIALRLAAEHRGRTVTCLAPAGGWEPLSRFGRALQMQFRVGYVLARLLCMTPLRRLLRFALVRRMLLSAMVARPAALPRPQAERAIASVAGCAALGILLAQPAAPDLRAPGAIDCPVQIAWSGRDRLLVSAAVRRALEAWVPDATIRTLPHVGHVPMSDDPVLVAAAIHEFVSGVDDAQLSA